MTEPVRKQFGGEISLLPLPGIKVWSDDIPGLVRRHRRPVQGPFVLIGRDKGLALDVGAQTGQGHEPQLLPLHARPWQLWYFRQTPHHGESPSAPRWQAPQERTFARRGTASAAYQRDGDRRPGILANWLTILSSVLLQRCDLLVFGY